MFILSRYEGEIIEIYRKAKWNIVCCGFNRHDDNYLKNFIQFVSNHDKILVCEMTSAYLYAIYMKKEVKIIHDFQKTLLTELLWVRDTRI